MIIRSHECVDNGYAFPYGSEVTVAAANSIHGVDSSKFFFRYIIDVFYMFYVLSNGTAAQRD